MHVEGTMTCRGIFGMKASSRPLAHQEERDGEVEIIPPRLGSMAVAFFLEAFCIQFPADQIRAPTIRAPTT